jgi:hypothetical protein
VALGHGELREAVRRVHDETDSGQDCRVRRLSPPTSLIAPATDDGPTLRPLT